MRENAIEIRELTKHYRDVTAVDHFSMEVRAGELLSLLGINGAGKTTLIGMLCGVIQPDAGDARLLGHSIVTEKRAAKQWTNISPQESAVAPRLTVRENLELMARIYGMGRREAAQAAEATAAEFDMRGVRDKYEGKLSGGWQRRLSIAMALISRPKILFLDEPTLGLDVLARRELWEMIRKLHGRVTLVMTTHYLEEAEALSDRIAIMKRGRLEAVGSARELTALAQRENFEEAFVALSADKEAERCARWQSKI